MAAGRSGREEIKSSQAKDLKERTMKGRAGRRTEFIPFGCGEIPFCGETQLTVTRKLWEAPKAPSETEIVTRKVPV